MSGDFDEEAISFSYFHLSNPLDNLISVQVQGVQLILNPLSGSQAPRAAPTLVRQCQDGG